jgi:mannose PTS system EIIA component
MIGIVIVTHGRLAEELLAAGAHVFGRLPNAVAINIGPDDDMQARRDDILAACQACDQGDGVVLLTDMFGGTPSNLAISAMNRGKYEVIAGVNLPMLIKLAEVRAKKPLAEACSTAAEAGRKYITIASAVLAGG